MLLFLCCRPPFSVAASNAGGQQGANWLYATYPSVARILFSRSRAVAGCGLSDKALLSPRRELLGSFRNHGFMVQTDELFVVNLGPCVAQSLALLLP